MEKYKIKLQLSDFLTDDEIYAPWSLIGVGGTIINQRLDSYYNRGFNNKKWQSIADNFIKLLKRSSFDKDPDISLMFFKYSESIMRTAVTRYYKDGSYPTDGIINYAELRRKGSFRDWFYYSL